MKIYTSTLTLLICSYTAFAQNNNVNSILVRHDTTLLNSETCEWVVKSLVKNDPALTSEIGKPIPVILLEAIEKGKLKAVDPETNKQIPAKEIFTWKMGVDTILIYDTQGDVNRYEVVKRSHSEKNFKEIRIFQDWYFDIATEKFRSEIKWIELMEDIISPALGEYIGKAAFCRIYY